MSFGLILHARSKVLNVIDLLTELGFTSLVFHRVQVARNIHECHNSLLSHK